MRRAWSASAAACAAAPNAGTPLRWESRVNSRVRDPAPASDATGVSPRGTPCRKFTVPYGMPVGVAKAGSSRSPKSKARVSSDPS